jgi:protein FRA10AC1
MTLFPFFLSYLYIWQVALRWRTEDEVLSGAGETSCGNIRCSHHEAPSSGPASTSNRRWDEDDDDRGKKHRSKEKPKRKLVTVELPFAYSEDGEAKSALVKVVLCDKCFKKLNWKREKDKELARAAAEPSIESAMRAERSTTATARDDYRITPRDRDVGESRSLEGRDDQQVPRTRRSRSRSPPKPYDIRDQWMR